MTNEILKEPAAYAIIGILASLIYIFYIQVVSSVMYLKYLFIKKYKKRKQARAETIDPATGNIVLLVPADSKETKFDTSKYDLATSIGFNLLFISILALIYIECNL